MPLVLAGYFPKRIIAAPPGFNVPRVREIWSVSDHMSKGPPDGWIDKWVHNELWFFDTPALARSVLPVSDLASYSIVAYRFWTEEFLDGTARELVLPDLATAPCENFRSLGFDAANSTVPNWQIECSPLSCNSGAQNILTNKFCLFPELEVALAGARKFSEGGWEPGTYRVVEVLREEPA